MVRLNIGCGNYYLDGWVNIDKDTNVKADEYYDISEGLKNKDNSVDEILLSHVLMYFTEKEVRSVLKECYRVLKKEGRLRITEDSPLKKRNAEQQKQYGDGVLFEMEDMVGLLFDTNFSFVSISDAFPEVSHHLNLPDSYPLAKGPNSVYFLTATK